MRYVANIGMKTAFENYGLMFVIKSGIEEKRARELMKAAIDATRNQERKVYYQA